jgi:protein gp37
VGENTKIEWTHHTFTPVLGCAKVHAGCTQQAYVMRKGGRIHWGEVWQGGDRVVVADSTWKHPFTWARKAAAAGERHRVFCASLSDVLEVPSLPEKWPSSWDEKQVAWAKDRVQTARIELEHARQRLWDTIRKTAVRSWPTGDDVPEEERAGRIQVGWPGLDWLLLTKRPENWRLVPEDVRPLVWVGTSVSDQETMNEYGARLLQARGFRYRFLSMEPLLGPVDLSRWMGWWRCPDCGTARDPTTDQPLGTEVLCRACPNDAPIPIEGRHIDQVIVGGESGRKARPCNVEWIRSIVRQCAEAGVPCHVKQLGAIPMMERTLRSARTGNTTQPTPLDLRDPKGGDMAEWPEDLRVRQFPK